ncbi:MAG: hypothetical protein M1820_002736 [Bogoriella megaspora]|nr:MAG: hypothetical protein M1820_002736 [Bogoriella megaspora]
MTTSAPSEVGLGNGSNCAGGCANSSLHSTRSCSYAEVVNATSFCGPLNPYALPSTGSGLAYASSCSELATSWTASAVAWQVDTHSSTSVFENNSVAYTRYTDEFYTLCDKHPRPKDVNPPFTVVTSFYTLWQTYGHRRTGTYPSPSPVCSVSRDDCSSLKAENQALSVTAPHSADDRHCNPGVCTGCTIIGGTVRLYYAPVKSASRDMCASAPIGPPITSTQTTIPQISSGTNGSGPSMISDGFTFDLNSAYISMDEVYAEDNCGYPVGSTYSGSILALPSDQVSSGRFTMATTYANGAMLDYWAYPFNYADLNYPIPWSAYAGQSSCYNPFTLSQYTTLSWPKAVQDFPFCNTIVDASYRPRLVVPPQVRAMDPAWSRCAIPFGGLNDPPYALTAQSSAAAPNHGPISTQPPVLTTDPMTQISSAFAHATPVATASDPASRATILAGSPGDLTPGLANQPGSTDGSEPSEIESQTAGSAGDPSSLVNSHSSHPGVGSNPSSQLTRENQETNPTSGDDDGNSGQGSTESSPGSDAGSVDSGPGKTNDGPVSGLFDIDPSSESNGDDPTLEGQSTSSQDGGADRQGPAVAQAPVAAPSNPVSAILAVFALEPGIPADPDSEDSYTLTGPADPDLSNPSQSLRTSANAGSRFQSQESTGEGRESLLPNKVWAAVSSAFGGVRDPADSGNFQPEQIEGIPNGMTKPALAASGSSGTSTSLPLTIGTRDLTPNNMGAYSIAPGETLFPGGEVTLSGTIVSLASDDAYALVGSSTIALRDASSTTREKSATSTPARTGVQSTSGVLLANPNGAESTVPEIRLVGVVLSGFLCLVIML